MSGSGPAPHLRRRVGWAADCPAGVRRTQRLPRPARSRASPGGALLAETLLLRAGGLVARRQEAGPSPCPRSQAAMPARSRPRLAPARHPARPPNHRPDREPASRIQWPRETAHLRRRTALVPERWPAGPRRTPCTPRRRRRGPPGQPRRDASCRGYWRERNNWSMAIIPWMVTSDESEALKFSSPRTCGGKEAAVWLLS